jgi:hypothetical protein
MDRTFASSMQAVTSSAVAIDAFYAAVKDRVKLDPELTAAWRKKRTARPRQIAEVFKRAFELAAGGFDLMSQTLEDVFKLRDQAIHPSGETSAPALHPRLKGAFDAPFVLFRFEHARLVYQVSLALIVQLARRPRHKEKGFVEYCESTVERTNDLIAQYNGRFGKVWPDQPDA